MPLCNVCGEQDCTCRPAVQSKVIWRNTEHLIAAGITKDEFGIQLYNTIMLIGGIMQLRCYLGHVAMGELPPCDYKQREGKLIDQVRTGLLALKADDVAQVVRRYPWVAAL